MLIILSFDYCAAAVFLFTVLSIQFQARLPQARVVYCSATGASEPRNMAYMVRLGLWGTGTSFLNFRDFLGIIFIVELANSLKAFKYDLRCILMIPIPFSSVLLALNKVKISNFSAYTILN